MLNFVVLALTVSYAVAGGYGNYGAAPVAFKAAPLAFKAAPLAFGANTLNTGYGGFGLAPAYAARTVHRNLGPITAAIQSTRTYEVVPVAANYEAAVPQTIDVGPNLQPINIIFRTQSSPLELQQLHSGSAPQYENTQSQDEASVLTHENYKPVIQEYKEVIQPYRKIEQRIQPVIENVHTVVARGEQYQAPIAVEAPLAVAAPLALPAPLAPVLHRAQFPLLAKSNGY